MVLSCGMLNLSIRHIFGQDRMDTSIDFFLKAAQGAVEYTDLGNNKGINALLSDDTYVTFRPVSNSDGSPAIQITVSGSAKVKNQRIHFMNEGD